MNHMEQTGKSSWVNAKGILPAMQQVFAVLICPGRGVPTLGEGYLPWLGVPTLARGIPTLAGGTYPGWGTPLVLTDKHL